MSAHFAPDDPAAIRRALIEQAAQSLRALPQAPSATELRAWIAPVSTLRLVACLGRTPNDTASRLADALSVALAAMSPREGIAALAASEFPELDPHALGRLIRFAEAVRDLAIEGDGAVTAADLFHRGFGSAEAAGLMPRATHLIGVLAGTAAPREGHAASGAPIDALRAAGLRATALAALA